MCNNFQEFQVVDGLQKLCPERIEYCVYHHLAERDTFLQRINKYRYRDSFILLILLIAEFYKRKYIQVMLKPEATIALQNIFFSLKSSV